MIRLNTMDKTCCFYEPPIPVDRHFGEVDTSAPADEQINALLWIPAVLVSRYMSQFPRLRSEGDELFSIGVTTVVEVVNSGQYGSDQIGSVTNVKCRRAMEDFANNIDRPLKVCKTTQYENRKRGVQTPKRAGSAHPSHQAKHYDDHSHLYLQDAAEMLGYDLDNLTRRQKKRLAEALQ